MATRGQKAVNIWVARAIPVILLGLIGYSAYVITKVVAIDYLVNPSSDFLVEPRRGSAVAILLFYYLLLIPLLVCYARLLQTITTNPGYVSRGAEWHRQREEEAARSRASRRGYHRKRRSITEKPSHRPQSWPPGNQDTGSSGSNHSSFTTSKEHPTHHFSSNDDHSSIDIPFWHRDIFVCNPDGRPPFCSTCLNHKPDRAHHCSEVDRCVLKMDHFCPWVGGIVSETSFKFFLQFLVYTALFCTMVLTTIAVFIAERRRTDPGFLDVHYFLILGISALFLLFSVGMAGSSIQLALVNSTTVENLNRRSKVWFLAVLIPRTEDGSFLPLLRGATGPRFQTITYPRPPEEGRFLIQPARGQTNPLTTPTTSSVPAVVSNSPPPRTFAILSTKPGENPFDIGHRANICEVMGHSVAEWVLPIKISPCSNHREMASAFRMDAGLLRRLKEESGLAEPRHRTRAGSSGDGRRSSRGTEVGLRNGSGDGNGNGEEDYGSRRKKRRRRGRRRSSGGQKEGR